MINELLNGMMAIMLTKFILNDVPHAAGLLPDPGIALQDKETITLYHATYEHNLQSILEHGITSRTSSECDITIDDIFSEYGLTRADVPAETVESSLERCRSTTGKVYLSIDKEYARANCLAGYEAEYELRTRLIAHKYSCPKPSFEEVFGQLNCVTIEVAVPIETMDILRGYSLKELRARERSIAAFLYRQNPEWGKERAEIDAHKQYFEEIVVDAVLPAWIQGYSQPYKGEYMYEYEAS